MTVLRTFLESSLNFPFNNLKKHYTIWYSQGEKQFSNLNCQKHSLKRQSGTKLLVKPTWKEKMTFLSTFLESSLKFLSNNLKNTTKFGTVSEKSGQKRSLKRQPRTQLQGGQSINLKVFKSSFDHPVQ